MLRHRIGDVLDLVVAERSRDSDSLGMIEGRKRTLGILGAKTVGRRSRRLKNQRLSEKMNL